MPMKFDLLPDLPEAAGAVPVDQGVPIATPVIGRPPKYPWARMAVGHSFFTEVDIRSHVAQMNRRARHGHFVTRKCTEEGRTGYRVWRVQ